MEESGVLLYICCPKCGKPLAKSQRCDGMELSCPKCGCGLRVRVGVNETLNVEIVRSGGIKPAV